MQQRTFHGPVDPDIFADALLAEFDHGGLRAQTFGTSGHRVVQVASSEIPVSGGPTALSVDLVRVEDGVHVRLGTQAWLGVAASLGTTAWLAIRNPLSLLARLDDLAQDLASIQLSSAVWETLDRTAASRGASHLISERLRRVSCSYCSTANPVGEPRCLACGAPLGPNQPVACARCGTVSAVGTATCPACGAILD
ncbi:MAG: zinc ribbon domain-containing protein [Anaerolineales bacterium]